jgi:branched-chain amino acid transport system ATP-binding protein
MASPKLLMLDELSLGLAPLLVKMIFETIQTINQQGITVLFVEQNARAALKLANYGYALETGTISLEGPSGDLLHEQRVRHAYLGEV